MITHALCYRLKNCRHKAAGFAYLHERRFVWADKPGGNAGSSDDKDKEKNKEDDKSKQHEIVTPANVRQVLENLAAQKKISDSEKDKAFEILKNGNEADKNKLVQFAQQGLDGNLNAGEFSKFLTEALKEKQDEDALRLFLKKKITAQAGDAATSAERIAQTYKTSQKSKNREIAEKMESLGRDFRRLQEEDMKYDSQIGEKLNQMVKEKKLTREQAQVLYDLDFNEGDAKKEWDEVVNEIKDPRTRSKILDEILKLKQEAAKNERKVADEYAKKSKEFGEMMNPISDEVMEQAVKERKFKNFERAAGVPLKAGQELVYQAHEDGQIVQRRARIKQVLYDDVEIKDDGGKVVKKINTAAPAIMIEFPDEEGRVDKFSPIALITWMNMENVTEDLDTKEKLGKAIGYNLKQGDKFEYNELIDPTYQTYDSREHEVVIKKIDETNHKIELDEAVTVFPGLHEKKKVFTFGEFARWFKGSEAVPHLESVEKLREELRIYNHVLNQAYGRDPASYPPIEVKPGEVLMYEDGTDRKFVIKEVTDKKITFDRGASMTPAQFLRWVKKNEVEKKDPDAEAHKATAQLPEGQEKDHEAEAVKEKTVKDNQDRVAKGLNPQENFNLEPLPDEPAKPSVSYIKKLWANTTLLSPADFFEMGKTIWEFIKRIWERKKKARIGLIGEKMFTGLFRVKLFDELGAEFKGVYKHAESEEVNHHVEHMRTMGIPDLRHELHSAPNKDILKAVITVLTEKGEMRWDDKAFWDAVDHLSNGMPKFISAKNHLDDLEKVLDSWWGEGIFKEFRSKQDSSYKSSKSAWEDHAKRLDADPEGLLGNLQRMLYDHVHGRYVPAARYEEYLHYAIEYGKLSFEQKLFFLIMGIAVEAPDAHGHGMTLLHIDRAGALEGDLLNKFPVLDYFTAKKNAVDENGKIIPERDKNGQIARDEFGQPVPLKTKPTINNYRKWLREVCVVDLKRSLAETDFTDLKPGKAFNNFLMTEVVWDDAYRTRLEKSARDPTNWDHDDMHVFGTSFGEETIQQLFTKGGGARQSVSNIGLRNTIAGYNNFLKLKMEMLQNHLKQGQPGNAGKDVRHMTDLLRSFIRFDAIMDRRFDHSVAPLSRLGTQELNVAPLVDTSRRARVHVDEIKAFIGALVKKFGLESEWGQTQSKTLAKNDPQLQQKIVSEFGAMLEGKLAEHEPEELSRMFNEIQEENRAKGIEIKGIPFNPNAKKEKADAEVLEQQQSTLEKYKND